MCLVAIISHGGATAARGDVRIVEAEYEGRAQLRVETPHATWWYDRAGGGFSRLVDRDGTDWIAFKREPLSSFPESAAAGFRGIPNAVFVGPDKGAGHPGFDRCRSRVDGDRAIRTTSNSGKWSWRWTFSDETATFEMLEADPDFAWWFLYEGPVAGSFAPHDKYWGTDLGGPRTNVPDSRSQLFERWRWVYFGDRRTPRILYVVHHQADDLPDNLWYLGSSDRGASTAPDGMIVFGFGRGPGTKPQFHGAGSRFTVGFVEQPVTNNDDHVRLAARLRALAEE